VLREESCQRHAASVGDRVAAPRIGRGSAVGAAGLVGVGDAAGQRETRDRQGKSWLGRSLRHLQGRMCDACTTRVPG
jgi:hypothetical protein